MSIENPPATCRNCADQGWVCENHRDTPWAGLTDEPECCGGAGAPCPVCNLVMASAGLVEQWRKLADRAISLVEDAIKDTEWGQPTFGPDYGEELRAEYEAMLATRQKGTPDE
jgi:hypothetical protein